MSDFTNGRRRYLSLFVDWRRFSFVCCIDFICAPNGRLYSNSLLWRTVFFEYREGRRLIYRNHRIRVDTGSKCGTREPIDTQCQVVASARDDPPGSANDPRSMKYRTKKKKKKKKKRRGRRAVPTPWIQTVSHLIF